MWNIIYFSIPIIALGIYIWRNLFLRLADAITYYQRVNTILLSRCMELSYLNNELLQKNDRSAAKKREELRRSWKSYPIPPMPKWMNPYFIHPRACPYCLKMKSDNKCCKQQQ